MSKKRIVRVPHTYETHYLSNGVRLLVESFPSVKTNRLGNITGYFVEASFVKTSVRLDIKDSISDRAKLFANLEGQDFEIFESIVTPVMDALGFDRSPSMCEVEVRRLKETIQKTRETVIKRMQEGD